MLSPEQKPYQKPYKSDLEVKDQHYFWITNVRETSSNGDRLMCKIWYANIKAKRSYWFDMKPC